MLLTRSRNNNEYETNETNIISELAPIAIYVACDVEKENKAKSHDYLHSMMMD